MLQLENHVFLKYLVTVLVLLHILINFSGCGISLFRLCFCTAFLTSTFLCRCALGAFAWQLAVVVLRGPYMLWIFLDLLGSMVRFSLSRANLNSVEWESGEKSHQCSSQRDFFPLAPQQARGRSAFLCIFTAFFQGYKGWRAFMHLMLLLIAFRLEKRTLSFCHCCNFRGVGGCGSLQWPVSGWVTPAVPSQLQDSCWVLPSPSSPEAVGLGDVACHFSLLPLQGRDCLTLVVYTAPSTMSALHIN